MPTVIRWPAGIPAGKPNHNLMTAMDLLPTFAKLADAELPADRVIDGRDILPVLAEGQETPHQAFFYFKANSLQAIRSGQWKLHLGKKSALYDLATDPGEKKNRLQEHPEIAEKLRAYAKAFEAELKQNSRPAGLVRDAKPLTIRPEGI